MIKNFNWKIALRVGIVAEFANLAYIPITCYIAKKFGTIGVILFFATVLPLIYGITAGLRKEKDK